MTTLGVTVTHKKAPIAPQQVRLSKGVEQFYYLLLFTSSPSYKGRPETWHSWVDLGFDTSVRVPPPDAADADKITITVRSAGKSPEIYAAGNNKETLQQLQRLLQDIDAVRGSVAGKEQAAKVDALVSNQKVAQQFVKPLTDCLKQSGLGQDDVESYMGMVRRGLLALTHDDVTSIQLSLN